MKVKWGSGGPSKSGGSSHRGGGGFKGGGGKKNRKRPVATRYLHYVLEVPPVDTTGFNEMNAKQGIHSDWVKATKGIPPWEDMDELRGFEAMRKIAQVPGKPASREPEKFKIRDCPHLFAAAGGCDEYPCIYAHRYVFGGSPDTEESASLR